MKPFHVCRDVVVVGACNAGRGAAPEAIGRGASFDAMARGYGYRGGRAESVDEIGTAVRNGLEADVATVIEVMVDPDSLSGSRRGLFADRV